MWLNPTYGKVGQDSKSEMGFGRWPSRVSLKDTVVRHHVDVARAHPHSLSV